MVQKLKLGMWSKSCSPLATGNARADDQLTTGGAWVPGYSGFGKVTDITVEKYNNEHRENILPFCNCDYHKKPYNV